jgi:curved DNA-binding protein CbpA
MGNTKNYYSILGVLPTAEPVVIQAAYRALAMKYHPDKWTGDKTTADRRMREINEAYQVLSNEQSRKRYDGARPKMEFDDYDFDSDATNDAFRDAEQAQRSDWEIALEYYPDLDAICAELRRTSTKLAFAFRTTLLETRNFTGREELAKQLRASFMETYFGRNPTILEFARTLIQGGYKDAAKELNRAVTVLGANADDGLIIGRIREKFFRKGLTPAEKRSAREAAETLLRTGYVSDAVALVEKLGGTVRTVKKGAVPLFGNYEYVVSVLGEDHRFGSEWSLAHWVIKTIAPLVLS